MKVQFAEPDNQKLFSEIKSGETFIHLQKAHIRVKHTTAALKCICGMESVTLDKCGLAVDLSSGQVVVVFDDMRVIKTPFVAEEVKS